MQARIRPGHFVRNCYKDAGNFVKRSLAAMPTAPTATNATRAMRPIINAYSTMVAPESSAFITLGA